MNQLILSSEKKLPKENEIKILDVDVGLLQKRLHGLGAKRNFPFTKMPEVAFDHPKLQFRKKGKLLRLRLENGRVELTLKGKNTAKKLLMRSEDELEVIDFKKAKRFLEKLDFVAYRDREKKREEWILPGGEKVDIDRWPVGEPYVEIESKNLRAIELAIEALGLERHERAAISSTELLKRWGVKNYNYVKFSG